MVEFRYYYLDWEYGSVPLEDRISVFRNRFQKIIEF